MHIPVLQKEVIEYLDVKPNENFIDATFGLGGHSKEILEKNAPKGKVLGIEIDPELYKKFSIFNFQFSNRLILVNDSYTNLKKIVREHNFGPVNGILFDLGLSSWHLEKSGRGFSFQREEPLDMRYRKENKNEKLKIKNLTAGEIVNRWPEKEIERILREYGEERFARRITRKIVETRKKKTIESTGQLVEIIGSKRFSRKTFQALRIVVNDELENFKKALPQALEVLDKKGRIVVISFHSLEDRIVKNFFKENSKKGLLKILTKKPIRPSIKEVQKNPRSRSAKLRGAIKILL
ncbi:16S rRNA (cytosine(1402)-N(4))-methyltransferase RsmH [bacterium]|nr:16S rRNA (cytosine(1402)-N(4))-methyltransferase RsmH [bacterium]